MLKYLHFSATNETEVHVARNTKKALNGLSGFTGR